MTSPTSGSTEPVPPASSTPASGAEPATTAFPASPGGTADPAGRTGEPAADTAEPVAEPGAGGGGGPVPPAAGGSNSHRARRSGSRKGGSFWRELPFLVLIALVLALLIKTFLVQAFYIPSGSMEQTLHGCPGCSGDRVLVNKLIYRFRAVHRGEIVVFRGPQSWQEAPEFTATPPSNPVARFFHDIGSALGVAAPSNKDFIKRVIGVGGDHVVCCDAQGRITVNGVPLDEKSYLFPGAKPSETPFDVTVPKGRLWVMGDNRGNSADSRSHITDGQHGTIPSGNVIGRAFVRVWPPSRWGTLGVPSTFHQKQLAAAAAAVESPLGLGLAGAVPLTVLRRRLRRRRSAGRDPRRAPAT